MKLKTSRLKNYLHSLIFFFYFYKVQIHITIRIAEKDGEKLKSEDTPMELFDGYVIYQGWLVGWLG